jgi:hypothetical protein
VRTTRWTFSNAASDGEGAAVTGSGTARDSRQNSFPSVTRRT